MGELEVSVYAVFSMAGLLHAGRALRLRRFVRFGALCLCAAVVLRIAPDLGLPLPGPLHGLASMAWAAAFLIWLAAYWPILSVVATSRSDLPPVPEALRPSPQDWRNAAE